MGAGAGYSVSFEADIMNCQLIKVNKKPSTYYDNWDYELTYRLSINQVTPWKTSSYYDSITSDDYYGDVHIEGFIDIKVDDCVGCKNLGHAIQDAERFLRSYLPEDVNIKLFYGAGWCHRDLPSIISEKIVDDWEIEGIQYFDGVDFSFTSPELAECVNNFYACPEAWYELEEAV